MIVGISRASQSGRVLIPETVDPLGPLETVGLLADRWMKLRVMKRTKKIMKANGLMKIKQTLGTSLLGLRQID